jgi:hypothetical protein
MTVTVTEMRNSVEQRFLVRVNPYSNGTRIERKPENPIDRHSADFRRAMRSKRLRRHSCPEACL